MGVIKEINELKRRMKLGTFNTDIEQFNKDYSADYLSNWHSVEDINTYYDRLSSLNDRTKAYQTYVNRYGTDEQKSVLGDIGKQISAYDEMIGKRQDVLDYYGGFGSAEEYGQAIEQSKADQEFYNTYDIESARNKLKGLEDAHKSPLADPLGYISDGGEYYGKIESQMRALEGEISRWENIDNAKRYSEYTGEAEYNPEFAKNNDLYDFVTKSLNSTELEQKANPKNRIYKNLKASELKKFYFIYEEQGEDEARKYLKFLAPYLEARNQADTEAAAKNHPFWMSVYAATQDILGVPLEQINDYIDYGLTGRMDYNKTAQEVEAIQGAVTEDMSGFGSFLYNTASSGATSLAAAGISKLAGGPAGEILLGLSAAAHTQNDILSRGGNSNQAAIGGIAAGAFEALFEHVSISRLDAFSTNDWIPNLKNAIREVAKSAGVNASEEMLTEIANIAFDMVNMGELSNAVLQYEELINNGATKAEAFWEALGKNIMQVAEAGASGALMGVGFGAIGTTSKVISRARAGKQVIKNANNPQEFTLDKLLKNSKEIFKGDKFQKEQRLIADIEKSKGRTDFAQKNRIGLLTEAYFTQGFKELNRELAEDSVNNIEKTKKTIENEATKTKVDNTNPTITNDNLPKILGFKEGKLSETVIETENGATAFTEESAANADIGTLYACAIRLGNTQSANNFVQNWDGKTDPFQYYLDFLKFQMRGTYAPDSYDKTMTDYAGVKMSPAAKHAAFQSGISLRESTKEKITKQSEALKGEYEKLGGKAKKGKFNDSKLNYSALTKEQKDVVNFTRILSDYLGVNVEFFVSQKGKRGANGYYKAKNNTIYLDIYAGIGNKESYSAIKDCLINTMSHEIVHNMKVTAPTEYAALRDFIIGKLSKQEGYDLDAKIEQIIAENSDQGFTVEDAIEEIVAMSCEDLLGSSEKLQTTLTEFYAQNEKAANSFTKYVREVLNRLKAFFEKIIGKKSIAEESQLMAKQSAEFISELQKRYDAALLAMREGNAVRNTQNATEGDKVKEQKRGEETKNIFGYEINKNASVNEDLLEELRIYDPDAEVNENGEITVYHRTSKDNATVIRKTGIMKAKEDALFFSSKPEGYATDYGDTVVTLRIPSTKLRINDIFDGEVHFDMPLKRIAGQWSANVSQWLVDDENDRVFGEGEKVMKQARENNNPYEGKTLYSDSEVYDYDFLISLKDMDVKTMPPLSSVKENGRISQDKAVELGLKNAESIGRKISDEFEQYAIKNVYTQREIILGQRGLSHSLDASEIHRLRTNARLSAMGAYLVQNAVPINGLKKENQQAKGTYAMACLVNDGKGYVVAIVTVDEFASTVVDISVVNLVHSINGRFLAKKEDSWSSSRESELGQESASATTISTVSIADFLEIVNSSHRSILSKDVIKHFNVERPSKGHYADKVLFQKRTENTTNRELLANALESTIDTSTEEGKAQLERLKDYKASVKRIATLEKQRAELVEKGMELMRKKGRNKEETAELASIWEKTKSLEKRISLHDKELLRLEALKPIQTLLEREKTKAVKKAKKQGTEKQKEIRENYARREYIKKIEDRVKGLTNAVKNVGDKHVPAPLREAIADLVMSLDFSSKSKLAGKGDTKKDIQFADAFRQLANLVGNKLPNTTNNETAPLDEFFIDCDITDEFRNQFEEIKNEIDNIVYRRGGSGEDTYVLRNLSSEQLRQINSALYKLGKQISKANQLMENNLYKNVIEMSEDFLTFADKFVLKQDVKWLEKLIDVDNLIPYYAFKRMGKVGMSLFNEWADGWDTYSKLSKDIIQFTKDLYTSDEVNKWTNEVHEFDINGDKYYLTTAHLMSFYLLHKQKDSRQHIEGYGIVVETFKTDPSIKSKQIKSKTYTNNSKGTHITQEVALQLLTELDKDKRAKEVADKLQNFMATECADWANYITMRRFGEKAYTIEDYFPIESSKNEMNTEQSTPNLMSLYALLNKSFTKARVPKANNKIMIRDVFDVFTTHTTEVAAYRSFGLPLLDMLKFYNFRQTHIDIDGNKISNSVKASIEDAFGEPFKNYLETFIRDVTGTTRSEDRTSEFTSRLISRYKIAAVAGNIRVIALQGTAYFRASAVLKHRYLLKEVKDTPQLRRAMKTMQEYSGIALWKNDLGFRDVNITNSLADKIKHKETITDKITEGALKGVELADNVTWASIWLACENEIKDTQKQLTAGSTEFYEAVALRFREVIYATQVVDSPLAKSQAMRSKSAWDKIKTSFMAEPTTSYNLLVDAYHEIADTKRRGEKVSQGNYLRVAKLVVTYVEGAVAQAVIESLIDAMRKVADDEDEELIGAYWEEVWQNTIKELSVFRKLPILKSISEAVESNFFGGYAQNQNMDVAVIDRALQGIKEVVKFINGESSITKLIKKIFNAISSLTGIPISNTYREIKTLWNNAVNMFNGGDGRIE